MKQLLLTSTVLATLSTGAMAADLPVRAAPSAPVAAAPVFTWTGFFAGVNAGYGFATSDSNSRRTLLTPAFGGPAPVRPVAGSFFRDGDDGGFTGGGQIGYNMQFGMVVAGLEADIQFVDLGTGGGLARGTRLAQPVPGAVVPGPPNNVYFVGNGLDDLDFFGTVRGRLGVAFDRALIYATGGLAWTSTDDDANGPGAGFFRGLSAPAGRRVLALARDNDSNDFGWTIGGGVEYAFTNSISAKIEGLYVNFRDDGRRNNIVGVTNTGAPIRLVGGNDGANGGEFAVVRAGLNFRFGTF